MKKIILTIQVFLLPFLVLSQDIKTYKGDFKNGTARYSYYENDNYKRIYHGSFLYKGETNMFSIKTLIDGQYKNNKKTGSWKYKYGNSIRKGKYDNGKLSGLWTEKIETDKGILLQASVKFRDGRLYGRFSYDYENVKERTIYTLPPNRYDNIKISGKFNSEGLFTGKWVFKYKKDKTPYKDIRKYKDGILFWRLHKNIATGEILGRFDRTTFVKSFFKNLDTVRNISTIEGKKYTYIPYSSEMFDKSGTYENSLKEYRDENTAFKIGDHKIHYTIGRWLNFAKKQNENYYSGGYDAGVTAKLLREYNPVWVIVPYKKIKEER
jgi:hypothetical protein